MGILDSVDWTTVLVTIVIMVVVLPLVLKVLGV
jgi:hypothetical protein